MKQFFPWEKTSKKDLPYAFIVSASWGFDELIPGCPYDTVLKWTPIRAAILRNINWESDFGAPECPQITVWTSNRVYWIHEYDGQTSWLSVAIRPMMEAIG